MKAVTINAIHTPRALLSALAISLGFTSFSANAAGFAEEIYMDFSEFSGNKVVFEVSASKPESLASSKNLSVGSFFSPGTYVLNYQLGAININDAKFDDENLTSTVIEEARQEKMARFQTDRLSLSDGTFRLLSVKASIGKEVRTSEAVEFCWANRGYCYVADNSIPNLYGSVLMIRDLLASGYQETVTYDEPLTSQSLEKAGKCYIRGTNSTSATLGNGAVNNAAVIVNSRTIGYVTQPASYINQTCVTNSNRTCTAQNSFSVPNASGTANRGYQIKCPPSTKQAQECTNRAFFASEQGCAFSESTRIWGFSFKAGPAGCSANVDYSAINTVAIRTRALDKNITCEFR